jgi:hypothetical protein
MFRGVERAVSAESAGLAAERARGGGERRGHDCTVAFTGSEKTALIIDLPRQDADRARGRIDPFAMREISPAA